MNLKSSSESPNFVRFNWNWGMKEELTWRRDAAFEALEESINVVHLIRFCISFLWHFCFSRWGSFRFRDVSIFDCSGARKMNFLKEMLKRQNYPKFGGKFVKRIWNWNYKTVKIVYHTYFETSSFFFSFWGLNFKVIISIFVIINW